MKTLEQIKKNKKWEANSKGYPKDPEGFEFKHLLKRLDDEYREFYKKITYDEEGETPYDISIEVIPEETWVHNYGILDELADMSNVIDYIATKIIVDYPTKYLLDEVKG